MRFSAVHAVTACAVLLSTAPPALASVQYFVAVPGIPGEVTTPGKAGQIAALSVSLQSALDFGTHSSCGGAAKAKTTSTSLTITKAIDKSSPKLLAAAATGNFFPQVAITVTKSDVTGQSFDFLLYKLSNAFIASVENSQSQNGDDLVERVTFAYTALETDYLTIAGDQPGTTATASWTFCKGSH